MTNAEYRQEFFEPVLRSVRRPILVHAVHRSLIAGGGGADLSPPRPR